MNRFFRQARRALFGCLLLASGAHAATSPDELWSDTPESAIARNAMQRQIVPERYRSLTLDRTRLAQLLAKAPLERAAGREPVELRLPLPDGSYGAFRVVESPIMEPALAAKYPQLKTYLGQGIDDPSASVRMDLTPKGFRAQIIGRDGTNYIDPYQPGDVEHYIAYRKHDHTHGEHIRCSVTGEPIVADAAKALAPKVSSGATLRTYRLAMAATGEYTAFHGGTVLDGLSAIVTTVNRVNGIYEREVSVRMVLVANNDQIVFTDAATDPYANTSGDLAANQSTINSRIGSANYDIGHLVGTGGGGVAGLGVVCGGSKARGLTGSGRPIGDGFDIDYVAHEMGHQFSGNHTFNGSGGSCAGGNRNGSTAYEPGSGITIQAYAGICGNDDLQPNSEDYFHRVSLNEILSFTTTGGGSSCGTTSATGNAVPMVSTPSAFTIPGRTPFTLTASGSDADGDALTYVWEQFDTGAANAEGVLNPSLTTGPLFRSFAPSADPSRTFPSLRYVLDNANAVPARITLTGNGCPAATCMAGEALPNASRPLNFRVTVRDNKAGGGGTNEASTAITVANGAGPFAVASPNSASVVWAAGSAEIVTWNVANTSAAPVSTANVKITLSTDGGTTFPVVLAASTPNDGTESVTLPAGLASVQARVKVEAVGNVYFDVSDFNFTITSGANSPPSINSPGAITTTQGGPGASAVVATVNDLEDAAGSLVVSVSGAPPELLVNVQNTGGDVTLSATALCTLVAPSYGVKVYPVVLRVTDSAGASRTAEVAVRVGSNKTPRLGAYPNVAMIPASARQVTPASPASDRNDNLIGGSVLPSTLPGGGVLSIAADGTVSITTTASTTPGTYAVRAAVADTCGATEAQQFALTVGAPSVALAVSATQVTSGNGLIEPNECNAIDVTVRNDGSVPATVVSAVLTTTTPNVTITQGSSAYTDIPAGGSRKNLAPFQISTANALVCLSDIDLTLTLTYAETGTPVARALSVPVGQKLGTNYVFTASSGATLPNDGTLVAGSQVDNATFDLVVPAGFNFSVYGTAVAGGTTLRASTNGNLQLRPTSGAIDFAPVPLPAVGTGAGQAVFPPAAATLFLQWQDWRMNAALGAGVYSKLQGVAPNREWIIEWRGRIGGDFSTTTTNNRAAIVLHENSNSFDYVYLLTGTYVNDNVGFATIGVQAASTGATFTQFQNPYQDGVLPPGTRLTASIAPAVCAAGTAACSVSGATLAQSDGQTTLTEGGATDTYSLVLNTAPSGTVTVALTPDAQVSVLPTSLTFDALDWNTPKSVTVTAVDDAIAEGTHSGSITHAASGGGYTGVPIPDVVARIGDNETLGVIVAESGGTAVAEGGATDSYTVRLNSEPTATVTIAIAPGSQLTVAPGSATFDASDWSTPKPITVTAVDDGAFEQAHSGTITMSASGGGYGAVSIANVVASITDNDVRVADLAITDTLLNGPVTAGQRLNYEVAIDNLTAGADVGGARLTFTLSPLLTNVSWTCVADPGASCPASGNGPPSHTVTLAGGTGVSYAIGADVPAGTAVGTPVVTSASVSVSTPYQDNAQSNNSAATSHSVTGGDDVFKDGFE